MQFHGMIGVKGMRPMSTETFNKRKGTLLPLLRERDDPPPRRMRTGEGAGDAWHANLRQLLESSNGTVVRGFKLFKLAVDGAHWRAPGWLATAHVVVATVSPSGTTVYTDPNCNPGDTGEFIFVPSARVHSELSDAQLLSGEWHLGSVVGGGGGVQFCQRFVQHEQLQGRARSVVATSVDALVAKPRVNVRLPPHFIEWARVRKIEHSFGDLAEVMGAPVFPCGESLDAEVEDDPVDMYATVSRNEEAHVDGLCGLKLELKCRNMLLRGELSVAEARVMFFEHFDKTYDRVRVSKKVSE